MTVNLAKTAWFCPDCQKYHAPHVETCPGADTSVLSDYTTLHKPRRSASVADWTCPECGKPAGQCDPDAVGHYRG